jgi:hypothetical protein
MSEKWGTWLALHGMQACAGRQVSIEGPNAKRHGVYPKYGYLGHPLAEIMIGRLC